MLALLLGLASPLALATCTLSGSPFFLKSCTNDTLDEVLVDDAAGLVVVSMTLDDEGNLDPAPGNIAGSCNLVSPNIFQSISGIALRSTHQQFDKAYQTLLIAAAGFLRVKINIVTGPSGTCDIGEVSLTP
jgi:hypothetical protein